MKRVDVERGVVKLEDGAITTIEEYLDELIQSEVDELLSKPNEDEMLEEILREIGLYRPDMF